MSTDELSSLALHAGQLETYLLGVSYHQPAVQNSLEDTNMLEAGATAPDFKLRSHDGEEISLVQSRGKWVVLHAFPLAFTGG